MKYKVIVSRSHAGSVKKQLEKAFADNVETVTAGGAGRCLVLWTDCVDVQTCFETPQLPHTLVILAVILSIHFCYYDIF